MNLKKNPHLAKHIYLISPPFWHFPCEKCSKNENVMIIEGEHEIYFNGIAMEEVVEGSF